MTLYYPLFESKGEEGIFMLGTLYSGTTPLHETPTSYGFGRQICDQIDANSRDQRVIFSKYLAR